MKIHGGLLALPLVAALATGCGGDKAAGAPAAASRSLSGPSTFSSVTDLRDEAVAAGYVCKRWKQDNAVTLAAESGSCSGDSVLSTYASKGDLQKQLDTEKSMASMLSGAGVEVTAMLVGPNWIFKDPGAASLRDALGGVVVSPKS